MGESKRSGEIPNGASDSLKATSNMIDSIENNVLTVRSNHASRDFLSALRKIREDGLFLDIVLG